MTLARPRMGAVFLIAGGRAASIISSLAREAASFIHG